MYKSIFVPVDNSDHSNQAIAAAIEIGRQYESKLTGCHVYAASMHDYRFKQMEFTLPEEYLEETELERQRKIHDSLITMGLELISDSYLDSMSKKCDAASLDFEPKMMDGKHHVEIVKEIQESEYDLTILGVMGIGRVRSTQIGSVCERVARQSDKDVWVVKTLPGTSTVPSDTILVGVDGSPQSFGALVTAMELAEAFDKKIDVVSVYDPYLHYSVFKGVVDVLTEKAAKIFRFEEQNQLHEEIIDTGLAQIYQSHLDVAEKMAQDRGVEVRKTLLDGKAYQKVLDHIEKTNPWLVVVGRIGVHSDKDDHGLGSNSENLLRQCPCDILLTTRLEHPELDVKAEESIRWTEEAETRFERVPDMVKGIARTAIYRLAVEQGHSVVSSDVLDDAMERYMPKYTANETMQLAESLALQVARARPTFLCKMCGVTSAEENPVKCSVCGSASFEVITEEMLDKIAEMEGGLEVETTYDGRKLKWTNDAKRALKTMPDLYQRRRAKARVEKKARIQRLPTVTLSFAQQVIEEETGLPLDLPPAPQNGASGHDDTGTPTEAAPEGNDDRSLIARDGDRVPLLSAYEWTQDAVERLFRAPAGFMRDRTQQRIELLATEQGVGRVDLALAEQGIALGINMMEEMVKTYEAAEAQEVAPPQKAPEPAPQASANESQAAATKTQAASESKCPFASLAQGDSAPDASLKKAAEGYLNEIGVMSSMAEARKKANDAAD